MSRDQMPPFNNQNSEVHITNNKMQCDIASLYTQKINGKNTSTKFYEASRGPKLNVNVKHLYVIMFY
jgi:hypothetical protein